MTTIRRSNPGQEEIKRQNLAALLKYVHTNGATSRATLTTDLGLNRSTIGTLTGELTAAGLVREEVPRAGPADATGDRRAGRPSLVVSAESVRWYAITLSIETDRLRGARVGLGGMIFDHIQVGRDRYATAGETVKMAAELIDRLRAAAPPDARPVGCGVAVCGMVRHADGAVRLSPNTGWTDEPFADLLTSALDHALPVSVGNVADLSALAEHTRGAAAGRSHVIYLYGDVGVGAGIITSGARVTGHAGYGGEVGHMVVHPSGHECGCGSRGCWETEIGEEAILSKAGSTDRTGRDAVLAVINAARLGDATARIATRQVGDWLGFGVANLANIFNPEVVLFGGTLRDVYLLTAATVRSRLNSMCLPACRENLRLRTPELGDDAALIGAAEVVFEPLLNDPMSVS